MIGPIFFCARKIDLWLNEELIAADQAENIKRRYLTGGPDLSH